MRRALTVAMAHDADVFRAFLEILTVLTPPHVVLARPGLVDRIMAVARDREPPQLPGPTRQELLALVG